MKIAITCSNGEVFQHFGHTPEFAIYEIDGKSVISSAILPSGESGHGALADLLAAEQVQILICGGIGGGAVNALAQANIFVVGGAEGNVREVTEAFLNGTLQVRAEYHCNHHHGDGHNCGSHGCGDHSCGGGHCH